MLLYYTIHYVLILFALIISDREEPLCYPGQVTLFDEYEYEYNGDPDFPLVTGYPAVCINNTFVPFCDTAGGGLFEARTACAFATNFTCKSCLSVHYCIIMTFVNVTFIEKYT